MRRTWISFFSIALAVGMGGCTITESKDEDDTSDLCNLPLTNFVLAPDWVRAVSPIRAYRYSAPLGAGETNVELMGESDTVLGEMTVEQLYGDSAYPEGSMHAVLRRDGRDAVALTTTGEMIDADRYRVRARLERSGMGLDVAATFAGRFCYGPTPSQSPLCVGDLALSENAYVVPSCGVLLDEMLWMGRAPTLERLEYGAAPAGSVLPGLSDTRFAGGYGILPVLDRQGLQDPASVEQWAQEMGVDGLLGDEGQRMLSTAFLDRTWWRELARHASHCSAAGGASLSEQGLVPQSCGAATSTQSEPVGSLTQAACDGSSAAPNASDWSDDGGAEDTGGFWGDPHMTSLDSTAFDFQAAGEFLMVESTTEPTLVVQARLEPMETKSNIPACKNISVGTALAIRTGQQRVVAYGRPAWSVWLDGTELALEQAVTLDDGGVLRATRGSLSTEWPNGQRIEFAMANTGRLSIALPTARRGHVRGLLGQYDGDRSNDFAMRDGRIVPAPPAFADLYASFGDSWRISQQESLFDYEPGQSTATFTLGDFPQKSANSEDLPSDEVQSAMAECAAREVVDPVALEGCILDVVCLGPSAADSARRSPTILASLPASLPGVMVEGNIANRPAPGSIDLSAWPDAGSGESCLPPQAHPMLLYKERDAQELDSDVMVNAPDSATLEAIAAGTNVTSYLLHRRPGASSPDFGSIYFEKPIVGIIHDNALLAASDAVVGHLGTTYAPGERAADASDDIRWGAGGRTLTVRFTGNDVDQVRILTEAP